MTHEERRKLIEAPFITCRIPGKSWGGTAVGDPVPSLGYRARARYVQTEQEIEENRKAEQLLYEEINPSDLEIIPH